MANRIAIVTGGAQGIGRAISECLAKNNIDLNLWDVSAEAVEKTAAEIAAAYQVKVSGTVVDVTDSSAVDKATVALKDQYGKIDILVNNAGITRDNVMLRLTDDDWDKVLAINLKGVFLCTKSVGRWMCKSRSGVIINISSVVGLMGNAGQANYSASKAGVIGLTKTTAKEYASRGVRCNAIAPGYIRTAMTDKLSDEVKDKMRAAIPLGEFGTAEDVAEAVAFLSSDAAKYITGQVLTVDGGMVM